MKFLTSLLLAILTAFSPVLSPLAFGADTATATLTMSGNAPVVFSLSARGLPGDIDLTPGVHVNNRTLGIMHLKYNVDIASIKIESPTGTLKNGATAYPLQGDFTVSVDAGCTSIDGTKIDVPLKTVGTGQNSRSATSFGLTTGVEEDCMLQGSWVGSAAQLPLGGKFSMDIVVTMVSI